MEVLIITAILLLATGGAEAGALAASPEVRATHGSAWAGFRSGWGREWNKSAPVRSEWSTRTRKRLRGPDRIRGVKPVQRAKRRAGRMLLGVADAGPAAVRTARFWTPLVRSGVSEAVQGYRDARDRLAGLPTSDQAPGHGPDQSGPVHHSGQGQTPAEPGLVHQTGPDRTKDRVTEVPGIGGDHKPERYTATTRQLPDGWTRGELFYSGLPEEGDQPLLTVDHATEDAVRRELADVVDSLQRDEANGVPARIAWIPLGDDGKPPSPYGRPLLTPRPAPTTHPSLLPPEQRCEWCDDAPQETKRGKLAVCQSCGVEIDAQTTRAVPNPDGSVSPATCRQCGQRATWGIRRGDDVICQDCAIRNAAEEAAAAPAPTTPVAPAADGPTAGAPAPAGTTTTSTEGTRMGLREIVNQGRNQDGAVSGRDMARAGVATLARPAGGGAEVDDLATLQRIAAQVVQQHEDSEFMKIIRMCQTLPEGTDFGDRVGKVLAEFAQACVALGKVGDEVAEMAPSVSAIAQHVRGEA